jgi:hypothetical protein
MLLDSAKSEEERGKEAGEDRGRDENGWQRRAARCPPQEASTTTPQRKLSWAFSSFKITIPAVCLRLQKQAIQKSHQFWHSMRQASAKSLAPSTFIEAPPSTAVLALH